MSQINNDGLRIRYGKEQEGPARVGRVSTLDDTQELVVRIVGTEVPATASQLIYEEAGIPQGAQIISANLYVKTLFTGSSSTLDIGVWSEDATGGTYTVVDADGIDAAIALSALNAAGKTVACDGAMTVVGTASLIAVSNNTRPVKISVGFGTAAFTAGVADLVIRYRKTV